MNLTALDAMQYNSIRMCGPHHIVILDVFLPALSWPLGWAGVWFGVRVGAGLGAFVRVRVMQLQVFDCGSGLDEWMVLGSGGSGPELFQKPKRSL